MRQIIIIAHNMRSAHNVGSLLRTAEGLKLEKVYLTGYTPHPLKPDDSRLPHIASKLDSQISKVSLGAEKLQDWEYRQDLHDLITELRSKGFTVAALEQHKKSIPLNEYQPPENIALLLGTEVTGLDNESLSLCDDIIEIPMLGQKESFNVVQAAAMALYHLRFR